MNAAVFSATIAASVGLLSAVLSFLVALSALRSSERERRDRRSQEVALALLPRRFEAYEKVWKALIVIEHDGTIESSLADDLIGRSIWLSPELRERLLKLLLADSVDRPSLSAIRATLLRDSAVANIDHALQKLDERINLHD